jgi:putative hydrolase of the HAD superfamily
MKLVTFDFWNTLFIDQHEEIRHKKRMDYAHQVFEKCKANLEFAEVEKAFKAAHDLFEGQWDHRRAFTMQDHVREMLRNVCIELPSADLEGVIDFFETVLLEHPPLLIANASQAVSFAASTAKVGLISDTGYTPGRTLRKILERHHLGNYFHAYSFSNETGVLKPNPATFTKILSELSIDPQDAVHVGDLEYSDIAGAKQIGMKAIKYIGSNPSATRETIADVVIEDLSELPSVLQQL